MRITMKPTGQLNNASTVDVLNDAIHATGGPWSDSLARIKNLVDARYPGFPWEERWFCQIEGARSALRILEESSRLTAGELERPATLPLAGIAVDSNPPVPDLTLLQRLVGLDWITADRIERALRLYPAFLAACSGDHRLAERALATLAAETGCESDAAAA
jgi:hypothetical protein